MALKNAFNNGPQNGPKSPEKSAHDYLPAQKNHHVNHIGDHHSPPNPASSRTIKRGSGIRFIRWAASLQTGLIACVPNAIREGPDADAEDDQAGQKIRIHASSLPIVVCLRSFSTSSAGIRLLLGKGECAVIRR